MPQDAFERDALAHTYADRHLKTDPGTRQIYYLRTNAPDTEIRFLEVNDLMAVRDADPIEPLDFGVNAGGETLYSLLVVDVTPDQFEKIKTKEIDLPKDWSLDEALVFAR
jgi:hypothetical protein